MPNPKFDEVKNLKKETDKRIKYINEKKKILKGYENNVIDLEVEILTNQIEKDKGKKMVGKISKLMEGVNNEIKRLENELFLYTNSTEWTDWLNKMYLEIDSVIDYPLQKKKEFLNNYLKKIDVEYIIKEKSHKMNFEFKYPIVDDKLSQFGKDKDGKRTYQIEDGMKSSSYKFQLKNTYKSKVDLEDKEKLNKLITHLRVEKSLSLNEVCKELNKKKFRTPTNKEWNKSLLSLHIKNMKVDVGK